MSALEAQGLQIPARTAASLNDGFKSLEAIAKAQGLKGDDVDAYIVHQLTNMGYRPDQNNAPAAFLRAVGGPPRPTGEGKKAQ